MNRSSHGSLLDNNALPSGDLPKRVVLDSNVAVRCCGSISLTEAPARSKLPDR